MLTSILILQTGSSGPPITRRTSSAALRPSDVTLSMLSSVGSTVPRLICSTRVTNERTRRLSVDVPGTLIGMGLPPTSTGVGRPSCSRLRLKVIWNHRLNSSGRLTKVHSRVFMRNPPPSGVISKTVWVSAKVLAQASKCSMPWAASSSSWRYFCIMNTSPSVFSTGVPVANTTRPPRLRRSQVLMRMSKARLLSPLGTPGTLPIMVGTARFLNSCASSTNSASMPSSSQVMIRASSWVARCSLVLSLVSSAQDLALDLLHGAPLATAGVALLLHGLQICAQVLDLLIDKLARDAADLDEAKRGMGADDHVPLLGGDPAEEGAASLLLKVVGRHGHDAHVGVQAIGLGGPLLGQVVRHGDQHLPGQAQALELRAPPPGR